MNKKSHSIITAIFLIGLWIYVKYILNKDYFIWVFILPLIIIGSGPDFDQAWNAAGHRNFAFHSIIPEVILFLFILPYKINFLSFFFLLMIPIVGIHCLTDCRYNSRKRTGFYTIKILMRPAIGIFHKDTGNITVWRTVWGLNGAASTIYLILNFIISIIILGVFIYLH